ncbi:hypothetical protein GGS23DRAFT_560041 [Durotheca rogersii]|uniref:uncharacterized protein n=1 Tax=Durotheca rogersii TaxID=419775 RepID=UPI002220A1E4|nr:uncharacterized protein GGS23DRAFT_560041 [Durotheca rogersii]KAI5865618.1 hypothetical protein GGS23DRAFT_560041 [Durotheca rogersii]
MATPHTILSDEAEPRIQFATLQQLFKEIETTTSDELVVQNVSRQDYDSISREREARTRKFGLRCYYADLHLMIVTIPRWAHEHSHTSLYGEIFILLHLMGITSVEWGAGGHTTYERPNGDAGEGDSTGVPIIRARAGSQPWPTLVIESGFSQSLASLRTKMRWWFSASGHEVKIVVLINLCRAQRKMVVEKWVERPVPLRPEPATTLDTSAALEPTVLCDQIVTVEPRPANTTHQAPASYVVTRGPLRLEFHLLLLRAPSEPGEGDVVVPVRFFEGLAERVWLR